MLNHLDQDAFAQLFEQHRHELRAHCYRMMGTLDDAEDMTQETFLRAWRGRHTYEGRASVRAWLYKIATHACLDALKKQPKRYIPRTRQAVSDSVAPIPDAVTDPIWLDPCPDDLLISLDENPEQQLIASEHITLAFIVVLHILPPRQRAILILCDVLDWRASEVADLLDTTLLAVKSALHRARSTLNNNGYHHHTPQALGSIQRDFLDKYVQAWHEGDVEMLIQLLADDAIFSMPPIPSWYRGKSEIRALIEKTIFRGDAKGRWRLIPTRANGQLAFGLYRQGDDGYLAYGVQVVTFGGEVISDIITFRTPTLVSHFKLPEKI